MNHLTYKDLVKVHHLLDLERKLYGYLSREIPESNDLNDLDLLPLPLFIIIHNGGARYSLCLNKSNFEDLIDSIKEQFPFKDMIENNIKEIKSNFLENKTYNLIDGFKGEVTQYFEEMNDDQRDMLLNSLVESILHDLTKTFQKSVRELGGTANPKTFDNETLQNQIVADFHSLANVNLLKIRISKQVIKKPRRRIRRYVKVLHSLLEMGEGIVDQDFLQEEVGTIQGYFHSLLFGVEIQESLHQELVNKIKDILYPENEEEEVKENLEEKEEKKQSQKTSLQITTGEKVKQI